MTQSIAVVILVNREAVIPTAIKIYVRYPRLFSAKRISPRMQMEPVTSARESLVTAHISKVINGTEVAAHAYNKWSQGLFLSIREYPI